MLGSGVVGCGVVEHALDVDGQLRTDTLVSVAEHRRDGDDTLGPLIEQRVAHLVQQRVVDGEVGLEVDRIGDRLPVDAREKRCGVEAADDRGMLDPDE